MDPFTLEVIREAERSRPEGRMPVRSTFGGKNRVIGHGHDSRVQGGDPVRYARRDRV